ncbi:GntR family transcriptional regulator [Janthinobacterium sp.]|uniref:GntR family transcriptional regulator n=1 Tax=Janthinobacterium sp. TaxID=1871054 RepID=UPI002617A26C|nr:GntR family transcriptional regulator [Janthinobacterium sp.]
MTLTALQTRVAREIINHIRRENLAVGTHLTEANLARVIGTSRFPVSAALLHLTELGIVTYGRNRGFFLAKSAESLADEAQEWSNAADDPLYLQIAAARQQGALPDIVNETELMARFAVSRSALNKVLSRIQGEGWIERRAGHGWEFLPMIDSLEAYEESYALRIVIEPAGILGVRFAPDRNALAACRKEQELIASGGYASMTAIELFEANARFHETVAACSGNRFILQTVRRLDQLRRLVEYRQAEHRLPRKTQAQEHLRILDCIAAGDYLGAATAMRDHLDGARRSKSSSIVFAPPEAA